MTIKAGDIIRITTTQLAGVVDTETDYKVLAIDHGVTCEWVAVLEVPGRLERTWRVNLKDVELVTPVIRDGWSTP